MAYTLASLPQLLSHGFDSVIDVRSPAEWADDHLPGAVNLPVLDDAERARVGTIYKQVSPFEARKIGGALVARNAARHIETALMDRPGGWRPLVYCWRGGQRSNSFATILGQIGWRVAVLEGGYKTWRRLVVTALYDAPVPAPVVVLDGNTGTAKTAVLERLAARGVQVIDLEGLANHRGSLFGARAGGQPGQKAFEGRLALALAALDPARPVVVEAESSRIGACRLPPRLWQAMVAAPRVAVAAPRAVRAGYLLRAYADLTADPAALAAVVDRLRPLHAAEVIARWRAWVAAGAFGDLAEDLMARHYDPRYARHRARSAPPVAEFGTADLSEAGVDALAARIAAALAGIAGG
ncbi:tRNA 2-selenouridine(34) synthase MnmH [Ruixingdingia sedimenti]|uniref:tRNA 2-selenouridine(34) synthase MnmH n=1 Tax=Ruixingdingia sedimenti TaxID=3073604 RepID=A0ABU1F5U0_9RHOB|nr:tRNA 2-selenouridine(34) synthase MnmH [Xinfangfangia sp. LG-4]MDR5652013.1 tRNA 2-selenouridine(34) synthase MnmH [Xinfangfangia sp. LG-4]